MTRVLTVAAALVLATAAALAQGGKPLDDKAFVEKATTGGLFEVESSKLVLSQTKAPAIRTFAQRMIDDHTKANQELETIAEASGLPVPTELDEPHRKLMEELRSAPQDALDRTYADVQIKAHRQAVELFHAQSETSGNAELSKFAQESLPVLEQHLAMAEDLPARLSESR